MALSVKQNDILLDISLSIGTSLNLHEMLETSLLAFLKALDASGGGVLFLEDMADHHIPFEPVCAIPQSIFSNPAYRAAQAYLQPFVRQTRLADLAATLPIGGQSDGRHYFAIFPLSDVGVMILTRDQSPFSTQIMEELAPLLVQLTRAIRRCLQNQALEKKLRLLQDGQLAAQQALARPVGNYAHTGAALQESEKRFRLLTEAAFEAIIISDREKILEANEQFARMFGYRLEDVIGSAPMRFLSAGKPQKNIVRCLEDAAAPIECTATRHDGRSFPVEIHSRPIPYHGQTARVLAIRDITGRRELEQMRDDFITAISHELRTPLASIMGFIETLLSGMPGSLTDVQRHFLQNSYKSSERLLELVEELIAATYVQKGAFSVKRQPSLPEQIVDKVVQKNMPYAEAKGIALAVDNHFELNRICVCDPDKIEHAVSQLVKNALKFTPEGGRVTVFSNADTVENTWHFEVTDTGIGIPEDELPFLFTRFFRASNAKSAEIQGAGLGLCLAKAVVEAHDGRIGIDSRLNQGTKAWFSIPLAEKS